MRALVTGGAGFIGSNLVHKLYQEGWTVEVVDDLSNGNPYFLKGLKTRFIPNVEMSLGTLDNSGKTVNVFTTDFVDKGILHRILSGRYDYIFHLAANPRVQYSVDNPTETTETNLLKSVGLFECATKGNVKRIVFSSTCAVYGDAQELPTPEDHRSSPNSPYGLQKSSVEGFAKLMASDKCDIVCLRYFNVYGPRQFGDSPYSTAVTAWTHAAYTTGDLRSDGDGTQTRDMVCVTDVVDANIAAALSNKNFKGLAYNICTGESISNNEILKLFNNKFSGLKTIQSGWRPGDVMHTLGCPKLARECVNFAAKTSFEKGLELTWSWWEEAKRDDSF